MKRDFNTWLSGFRDSIANYGCNTLILKKSIARLMKSKWFEYTQLTYRFKEHQR